MKNGVTKGIIITFALIVIPFILGLLITYEVINVEFIGFMENQVSIRPMEMPLPVSVAAIPVQGAAYVPGAGSPENPVEADEVSIERGRILFDINCKLCHGPEGQGDGPVAPSFTTVPPRVLTDINVVNFSDGDIFLVITNGRQYMPALRGNIDVRGRWDVVNFVRQLQGNSGE